MGRPVNSNVPESGYVSKQQFDRTGSIAAADFAVVANLDNTTKMAFDPSGQTAGKTVTIAAGANSANITLTLPTTSATLATTAQTYPMVAIMKYVVASGTFDAAATGSSTYDTRNLNTLVDPSSLITSLAANVFTITAAGTYRVQWIAPLGTAVGGNKSRLYNVTGSAIMTDIGTNQCVSTGGNDAVNANINSIGDCLITVTAGQQFRIEHAVATHQSNNDYGAASSIASTSEIYSVVSVTRLS